MNDEPALLINMALENRLSPEQASVLMRKINEQNSGTSAILSPLPPEAFENPLQDFDRLFSSEGCRDLLTLLPAQMTKSLESGDYAKTIRGLAMLDVAELAESWTNDAPPGYMFGEGRLEERQYGFHLKGGSVHYSGESLAMRLFGHPVPARWQEESLVLIREEEEKRVEYTVHSEPEAVSTRSGDYEQCLKVTYRLSTYHLPFVFDRQEPDEATAENRTAWFAPGVGPVRAIYGRGGETIFEVELTEAQIAPDEAFFPHETGNWWLFEGTSQGHPHRELWRSLAADENQLHWFTVAAYPYNPEDGQGEEE